jgi:hypothetical protein
MVGLQLWLMFATHSPCCSLYSAGRLNLTTNYFNITRWPSENHRVCNWCRKNIRKLRISGKTKSKYHLIVLFHHTGVFRQCLSSQQCFSQLRCCNPALNALGCRPVVIWLSGSAPWLFSTTWIQLLLGRSVAQNDFNQTIFEEWPIERRLNVFLLYLVMLWKHNYLLGLKFKL